MRSHSGIKTTLALIFAASIALLPAVNNAEAIEQTQPAVALKAQLAAETPKIDLSTSCDAGSYFLLGSTGQMQQVQAGAGNTLGKVIHTFDVPVQNIQWKKGYTTGAMTPIITRSSTGTDSKLGLWRGLAVGSQAVWVFETSSSNSNNSAVDDGNVLLWKYEPAAEAGEGQWSALDGRQGLREAGYSSTSDATLTTPPSTWSPRNSNNEYLVPTLVSSDAKTFTQLAKDNATALKNGKPEGTFTFNGAATTFRVGTMSPDEKYYIFGGYPYKPAGNEDDTKLRLFAVDVETNAVKYIGHVEVPSETGNSEVALTSTIDFDQNGNLLIWYTESESTDESGSVVVDRKTSMRKVAKADFDNALNTPVATWNANNTDSGSWEANGSAVKMSEELSQVIASSSIYAQVPINLPNQAGETYGGAISPSGDIVAVSVYGGEGNFYGGTGGASLSIHNPSTGEADEVYRVSSSDPAAQNEGNGTSYEIAMQPDGGIWTRTYTDVEGCPRAVPQLNVTKNIDNKVSENDSFTINTKVDWSPGLSAEAAEASTTVSQSGPVAEGLLIAPNVLVKITESGVGATDLTKYDAQLVCQYSGGDIPAANITGEKANWQVLVPSDSAGDLSCTVTNLGEEISKPHASVQKNIEGDRAANQDQFTFDLSQDDQQLGAATTTGQASGIQEEKISNVEVDPGSKLTITETAGNNSTELADYEAALKCVIDQTNIEVGSVSDNSWTLTVPETATADDNIVCTITNSAKAKPVGVLEFQKIGADEDGIWDSDNPQLLSGSIWKLTRSFQDDNGQAASESYEVADCVAQDAASCNSGEAKPYDNDPVAGKLQIIDLNAGDYQLEETKAPAGFKLDKTVRTFTIDGQGQAVTINNKSYFKVPMPVNSDDENLVDLGNGAWGIKNKQSGVPPLPLSGGLGRDAFLISGLAALLLGAGVTIAVGRKRQQLQLGFTTSNTGKENSHD